MSSAFLILVLASIITTRLTVVCLALAAISVLLSIISLAAIDWTWVCICYCCLLAIPVAACLAGHIAAGVLELPASRKLISFCTSCCGFVILLESEFLSRLLTVFETGQAIERWAVIVGLMSKVVFAVALIVFVVTIVIAGTELAMSWCLRKRADLVRFMPVVRPVLLLLVVSLLVERIILQLTALI